MLVPPSYPVSQYTKRRVWALLVAHWMRCPHVVLPMVCWERKTQPNAKPFRSRDPTLRKTHRRCDGARGGVSARRGFLGMGRSSRSGATASILQEKRSPFGSLKASWTPSPPSFEGMTGPWDLAPTPVPTFSEGNYLKLFWDGAPSSVFGQQPTDLLI